MAIIYEKKGRIAYITLNRPDAMNALDATTFSELSEAWTDVRDDDNVWVAILSGAGEKAFCAGADLTKAASGAADSLTRNTYWAGTPYRLINNGIELWKPVIAAVNGYCLGGGMTMLLGTDIRIAAEHAQFGVPEPRWGILPGNGGTQRLLRQVPYAVGMELLLVGDRISAQEAYRIGLVNRVVPMKDLLPAAEKIAERICENGPLAVRAIKELAVRGLSIPLEHGIRYEVAVSKLLTATEDAKEGPLAFKERRKPKFQMR